MTIIYLEDEYKAFWDSEYKLLTPLKNWLESQGHSCTLKPPQTCLRIWSKALGCIPWNLVIMVNLKGEIRVFDKKYTHLAEQIAKQIHEIATKEEK